MVVVDINFLLQSMAWPLVLLLAWFLGERLHERWRVPRVTSYVGVGLLGGLVYLPGLTGDVPGLPFLANVALSLVLFELGYRIHLRWFRHNPWVLLLGVVESLVTFGAVFWASGWFGLSLDIRLMVAALSISASPAGILRVANELRSTHERGVTVVFALAVLLLTTMAYGLKLSPLLGALTFGIVARERRVNLSNAQRDFGTAGDLLSVFLFVYIASLLDWGDVGAGMLLGLVLIAVRTAAKVVCNLGAARLSGISERKGLLTGLALTPMSAFAILLLEQTRLYGFAPAGQVLGVLAGMMMLQELLGPVVTQRALMAAHETHVTQD
jgi:Kef-type K+ transport system membrane component KefB